MCLLEAQWNLYYSINVLDGKVLCSLLSVTVAMPTEYNTHLHYQTKHPSQQEINEKNLEIKAIFSLPRPKKEKDCN